MTGPVPAHVVVAGEALVDLVWRPDGVLQPLPGGGPFNTARTLGRLGTRTTFLGAVSNDRFGQLLSGALAGDNVLLDPRLRTERPTSLAIAELDANGGATYRFHFSGTSAEGLTVDNALEVLPHDARALHIGSLGLVLEPLALAVEAAMTRLSGSALIMVDPNMRPSIVHDRARHAVRLRRIMAQSNVVKVSDEDLRALSPDQAPADAARALLDQGPRLVLLTLGAKGVIAFGAFGAIAIPSPVVKVVDTIGAGDIFSGAWLAHWLAAGGDLADRHAVSAATAFACSAAALSCARKGASPPTRSEMTQQTGNPPPA